MKKIIKLLLILGIFIGSANAEELNTTETSKPAVSEQQPAEKIPELSEIIPLSAKLISQSKRLENTISKLMDTASVDKQLAEIQVNLAAPVNQLERLKESTDYQYNKLLEIKELVKDENESFLKINKPLNESINQLGQWRKQWLKEKKDWQKWQTMFLQEEQLSQLQGTFDKVNETIDSSLNLIQPQLEALLKTQSKAALVQVTINTVNADLENLTTGERYSVLYDMSPPMFTKGYYTQFSGDVWLSLKKGVAGISWLDKRFIDQQGWIIVSQILATLTIVIVLYKKRALLSSSERWHFLSKYPLSMGLFIVSMLTMLIYAYEGAPLVWKIPIMVIAGASYVRLTSPFISKPWKKHFLYGLTVILISSNFLELINCPDPVSRLYILLVVVIGLIFCRRCLSKGTDYVDTIWSRWILRCMSVSFVVIMIAEVWGKKSLASYLFNGLFDSFASVIVFLLLLHILQGIVEWLFRSSFLKRAAVLYSNDTDLIIRRVARFIDIAALGFLLLPGLLMIWGLYDNLGQATQGLLSLGFNLGTQRITVGLTITAIGVVYGSYLFSWLMQKLFMDVLFRNRQVERGVRLSIERLIHYVILFVGFLLAISMLGFEVTKITIVLSALGVGIGFGLQGVVNNFVSGLILLFERPVRVGDTIQLGEKWAEIRRIGLRSTTIKTFDEADVIVPNSDFISNQVTNWTLSNRLVRLSIPVGVAYGSDVQLVMETLTECTKENQMITRYPPTQVLFVNFGDSALNFELRVWVKDADNRLIVRSDLLQEIDKRFREKKIEISFPQRDLHLRSMDPSVTFRAIQVDKKEP